MSGSAITFYLKEIIPDKEAFKNFLTEFEVVDITVPENEIFADYLFKILFRKYHNSNVQYDTPDDFKSDLANILEDSFFKFKKQVDLSKKIAELTDEELLTMTTALANSANNPNSKPVDPTKPFEFVGAQAFTLAKNGKFQAYLTALNNIPTKLIDEMLLSVRGLFKTFIPNQIYVYREEI